MFKDTLEKKNQINSLNIENQLVDLSRYDFNEIINQILSDSTQQINCYWLGRLDYHEAWELQKQIQQEIISNSLNDVILFLEHNSIYTLGKNADSTNLLPTKPLDMEVIQTDRGGDITYHGPGQLIGYPIIDLKKYKKSITWFMRGLENSIIQMLKHVEISSTVKRGLTGVWVNDKKIAALGVRLSRWVSMHGFAINVYTDLTLYRGMIPCGILDFGLTSILKLKGEKHDLSSIARLIIPNIKNMLLSEQLKKVENVQV
jgi:lipoate-protein ligase B